MAITVGEICSVAPLSPDNNIIARAAECIQDGGLVVFPTSTFYGLGALAFNKKAVDRIFSIKGRDPNKPILILIADSEDLIALVRSVPLVALEIMEAFWPGNVTLVFEAAGRVPKNLTGHSGKIGIRLASHPVATALVKKVGSPITGTSANLSGQGGCIAIKDLDPAIGEKVELILDAGVLQGNKGSTVVDVTCTPPQILREGVLGRGPIEALLRR